MRSKRRCALACLLALPHVAVAQEAAPTPPAHTEHAEPLAPPPAPAHDAPAASAWQRDPLSFDLSFYLWAPSLDGDVTAQGASAQVDADFLDVLQDSDSVFGFSGRLDARYDRLGAFVDATYMKTGVDAVPTEADRVDVTSELTFIDFGVSWRIADEPLEPPTPSRNHRALRLDAYAGARYTDLALDLDPREAPSSSRDKDWIDPIVGLALELDAADNIRILARGDVGGFGVNSDFTWSALAGIGFNFEMFGLSSTAWLGYRALGQDYSDGSGETRFEWDMILHGPALAITVRF